MSKTKKFKPHDFQVGAIAHLLKNRRAALWAKPGMGKTPMVLAALDTLAVLGEITTPVLVIATKRIAERTWSTEAAKWDDFKHLRVTPVMGNENQRLRALATPSDIYTTNYEQIPWLVDHFGAAWPFSVIVADESTKLKNLRCSLRVNKHGQFFLKGENGSNSRALALARVAFSKITHFWALTGSPSANGLLDLWGQTFFLDNGERLGRTFGAFQSRWFERVMKHHNDKFGELRPRQYAQEQITRRLSDVCYAIDPKDWFDLREPIHHRIEVDLPASVAKAYRQMQRDMFVEINNNGIEAFSASSMIMKCRQLASGTIYTGDNGGYEVAHTEKIQALSEIYNECGGVPLLVAYNFKSDREMLLSKLEGCVDIATPKGFEDFMSGKAKYGIGHPQSVGHGIDGLQHITNVIVFYSSDFNLEYREQMLERIGPTRQFQGGYDRPVYVYDIVAFGTVDEMILNRVETKCSVQEAVFSAMKRLD